jgi:hypothetical protein
MLPSFLDEREHMSLRTDGASAPLLPNGARSLAKKPRPTSGRLLCANGYSLAVTEREGVGIVMAADMDPESSAELLK